METAAFVHPSGQPAHIGHSMATSIGRQGMTGWRHWSCAEDGKIADLLNFYQHMGDDCPTKMSNTLSAL